MVHCSQGPVKVPRKAHKVQIYVICLQLAGEHGLGKTLCNVVPGGVDLVPDESRVDCCLFNHHSTLPRSVSLHETRRGTTSEQRAARREGPAECDSLRRLPLRRCSLSG